jgi:spermidine synthase
VREPAAFVDRMDTPRGEFVLRRDGNHFEIIGNGTFLMDTRGGRSERLLVRAALEGHPGPVRLLIGGLGVGFSLAEALADERVAAVTVIELESAVIKWQRAHLSAVSGVDLADPRLTIVCADLVAWLAAGTDVFDAICLDVDNGPEWTVSPENEALYGAAGLREQARHLRPGGTLAVWSAAAAPAFGARLRALFADVRVLTVAVPRGEPDVVYVARAGTGAAGVTGGAGSACSRHQARPDSGSVEIGS